MQAGRNRRRFTHNGAGMTTWATQRRCLRKMRSSNADHFKPEKGLLPFGKPLERLSLILVTSSDLNSCLVSRIPASQGPGRSVHMVNKTKVVP